MLPHFINNKILMENKDLLDNSDLENEELEKVDKELLDKALAEAEKYKWYFKKEKAKQNRTTW